MKTAINLNQLCEAYQNNSQIVLYTGSGISTCQKKAKYGIPTWTNLLNEIGNLPENTNEKENNPFELVKTAIDKCGSEEEFFKRLRKVIEEPINYTKSYGLLSRQFLNNANTLNAVAAFCGELEGQIIFPKGKETDFVYFQTKPNRRIHAVLTSNYDCFLEAGAATLFRKNPLKPVTALGSQAGDLNRIPVFHIHGYIPHPFYNKKREPAIKDLIITEETYKKNWNETDVFGTTMGPQIHYLRYYTTVFIGFSFNDEYVCKLLRRIYKDSFSKRNRIHFAFVDKTLFRKHGENFFREMGITPVIYQNHKDLPYLLGEVYRAGLQNDFGSSKHRKTEKITLPLLLAKKRVSSGESVRYPVGILWDIVQNCRLESIRKSKFTTILTKQHNEDLQTSQLTNQIETTI